MQLICPNCQTPIDADEVNVKADVAKCVVCENIYKASDLVETINLEETLILPGGSRIQYESSGMGSSTLTLPRQGLDSSKGFPIGFATFWMGFIAFWTWGALQSSLAFALFSIPFWLVGLAMWIAILKGSSEVQVIGITPAGLKIHKYSIISNKQWDIGFEEIDSINLESPGGNNPFSAGMNLNHAAANSTSSVVGGVIKITYGIHKLQVGENLSQPEIIWLNKLLKAMVSLKTKRNI